jgi:hypothetical protein
MSRKLYVSSDISVDEALAEIADESVICALLWPWLIVHLDDWGRSSASTRRLKASMAPMMQTITVDVIEAALQAFALRHLIALYEVDGDRFLAVNPAKWWRYQTHIHKSKRDNDGSSIPPPPDDAFDHNRGIPRELAEPRGGSQLYCASPPPSLPPSLPPTTLVQRTSRVQKKDGTIDWTAAWIEAMRAAEKEPGSASVFGRKVKEIKNLDECIMKDAIARMVDEDAAPFRLPFVYDDCKRAAAREMDRVNFGGGQRVR